MDDHHRQFTTRAEVRLIARAIREGWPTPPDQRAREVERLAAIIDDPASPTRLATAAAWVALRADGGPPRRAPEPPRGPRRRRGRGR